MTEVPHYVADTHAILWHLDRNPRLSRRGASLLGDADVGRAWVHVSAISLVEIVYLIERGRLDATAGSGVLRLLSTPDGSFGPVPVDLAIVEAMGRVPRSLVPDMPDRIITATALALGLPLISVDERIRAANVVEVVW